eukprot:6902393-Pyramimonas_sp.AAC.1
MGVGGRKKVKRAIYPAAECANTGLATTPLDIHERWTEYFAQQEHAASITPDTADAVLRDIVRVPKHQLKLHNCPTYYQYEKALAMTGHGAAGLDGQTGDFIRAFATELAPLYFPLVSIQ